MASTRKSAAHTARKTAGKAAPAREGSAPAADAAALPFEVELTRSVVGSTLGGAQALLRYLDELQRTNAQALKEMATILDGAVSETRRAGGVNELLTLQASLASAQLARAAQAWGSVLASWLDAGTQFAEQAQQDATRMARPVLGSGGAGPAPLRADAGALALLGSAQEAMTQWSSQWVEMVKDVSARAQLAQL